MNRNIIKIITNVLNSEHMIALVSDAFWYIICIFFKDAEKLRNKIESFLDRMAANFVSLFIDYDLVNSHFSEMDRKNAKKTVFTKFYDYIAQAVCYSLFYAFPKSRTLFKIEMIYRMMKVLSNLFNGITISQTNCEHWNLDLGTGNEIQKILKSI